MILIIEKNDENEINEENFDHFIKLLDNDNLNETVEGDSIDENISSEWLKILKLSLPKEVKQELLKKVPIPKNCITLKAPEVNQEIKNISIKNNRTLISTFLGPNMSGGTRKILNGLNY